MFILFLIVMRDWCLDLIFEGRRFVVKSIRRRKTGKTSKMCVELKARFFIPYRLQISTHSWG